MAGLGDAPPVRNRYEEEAEEKAAARVAAAAVQAEADEEDDEDDPNYVVVELGPNFANRIFHEFDNPEPGQEALVVAGRRVRVRLTGKVREALVTQLLVVSKKPATPKPPDMRELQEDGVLAHDMAAKIEREVVERALSNAGLSVPPPPAPQKDAGEGESPAQGNRQGRASGPKERP